MDGWMNGWMDGYIDGWMDGWMNGWIYTGIDGCAITPYRNIMMSTYVLNSVPSIIILWNALVLLCSFGLYLRLYK